MARKAKPSRLTIAWAPAVEMARIRPNPWNPNVLTATIRRKLRENIEREGFLDPVTVTPDGDEFVILDGEQRYAALKEIGTKFVPAVVVTDSTGKPVDAERARLLTLSLNHLRGEDDPVKLAKLIGELSQSLSFEEIADLTVFSSEQLKALRVYDGVDPDAFPLGAKGDSFTLIFVVTKEERKVIDKALDRMKARSKGTKLARICATFLKGGSAK